MFGWVKKHRFVFGILTILLFVFFIIIIPLILNKIYYAKSICNFFIVGYSVDYILGYYGNVLTFVGTISLGIITVYQNHISQQKTEEINRLQLQIAKRNMALAEESYQKQKEDQDNKLFPKFELKNSGHSDMYSNLNALLKNVSPKIIYELKSVSFEVLNAFKRSELSTDKVSIKTTSLLSGDETLIEFHNDSFCNKFGDTMEPCQLVVPWMNANIIWKFECNDEKSRVHYYEATLYIENCSKFIEGPWIVKKIG